MELSHTTTIRMQEPTHQWWEPILSWIGANSVLFMCFGLAWKFLDKLVEIWDKSQDARINRLIDTRLNPELKKLSESIDSLKEAIWSIQTKHKD